MTRSMHTSSFKVTHTECVRIDMVFEHSSEGERLQPCCAMLRVIFLLIILQPSTLAVGGSSLVLVVVVVVGAANAYILAINVCFKLTPTNIN